MSALPRATIAAAVCNASHHNKCLVSNASGTTRWLSLVLVGAMFFKCLYNKSGTVMCQVVMLRRTRIANKNSRHNNKADSCKRPNGYQSPKPLTGRKLLENQSCQRIYFPKLRENLMYSLSCGIKRSAAHIHYSTNANFNKIQQAPKPNGLLPNGASPNSPKFKDQTER